ncbi:unnamed protein product [Oncorhynchus mykiss]|uniref:Uncharacterized protein n=1 Tax=Oncorhynchus mykiss TaxID=8022 RepID=A0A060W0A0_ONCMY|nr:unnamed protein product [Oncorhynchus mykiss]
MSWFLGLWISLGFLLLCQATLYETIQQHHVPRPGRNAIQILGEPLSLFYLPHHMLPSTQPVSQGSSLRSVRV